MRVAQLYVIWEPAKEGVPDDKGFQRCRDINKSRKRNQQKVVNAGTATKGPHANSLSQAFIQDPEMV